MSFEGKYDFVFAAIKKAALQYSKDSKLKLTVERADQNFETKENKIEDIKSKIAKSDFCIIDFSDRSANVMWEFGYCQCLKKNIIPITTGDKPIPFNILGVDYCQYELSLKGLESLMKDLNGCFTDVRNKIKKDNNYMFYEPHVSEILNTLQEHLIGVNNSSLTRELVHYELDRISRRMGDLKNGRFDLRKEKPLEEIIELYSEYIEQLEGKECEFITVTCSEFWKEITDKGRNNQYLEANKKALMKGAKIKRVFVLNELNVKEYNEKYENVINNTLDFHKSLISEFGRNKISVRIIGVKQRNERDIHKNFGILRKENEWLLFEPEYNNEKEMVKTEFYHSLNNESPPIRKKIQTFHRVFGLGKKMQ